MLQRITLTAEFEALPKLAAWVEAQAGLDSRQAYAIQLCLEEVAVNLVMHGRPACGDPVQFTVTLETQPLRLTVEDDGIAFDPTEIPASAAAATLETASRGGLGLKLVNAFTEQRDYARLAGRNRLILRFA